MYQKPILTDFTAGELSPKFSGRSELEIYNKGCATLENWVPFSQGGVRTRPGMKYLGTTQLAGGVAMPARLIPFVVDESHGFVVEVTNHFIQVWQGDAVIANAIASPYHTADLFQIQFCKVCNELYLVHPLHPIQVLTWTGGVNFTMAALTIVTMDNIPAWQALHDYVQEDIVHGLAGGANIVFRCITSGTSAGAIGPITEEDDITDGTVHWTWEYTKPFSAAGDYPSAITHFNGRMFYAGSVNNRQTVWASCPWDYGNFNYCDIITYTNKQLKAEATWANPLVPETEDVTYVRSVYGEGNALSFEIASDQEDSIYWMVGADALIIGTSTAEWIVPPSVSAVDIQAKIRSRIGSAQIQATFFGDAPVFVQGSPASAYLREYAYLSQSTELSSPDLTYAAEQMLDTGVVQMDFCQLPQPTIFCVTVEGEIAALLYNKQYGVAAWYHIRTDQNVTGTINKIESVCVIPGAVDDDIYVVVNRVAGNLGRCVERFDRLWDDTSAGALMPYRICLDSWTDVALTGATTAGLDRFASIPVIVANITDGTLHVGTPSGAGVLTYAACAPAVPLNKHVVIGLYRTCKLQTMRINTRSAFAASGQGVLKRINSITARVLASRQFSAGSDLTHLETSQIVSPDTWPYTGDIVVPFVGNWDRNAYLWLHNVAPWTSTILSLIPEVDS